MAEIPPIFGGPSLFGPLLPADPSFEGIFRWLDRNAPNPRDTVYVVGASRPQAQSPGAGAALAPIAVVAALGIGLALLLKRRA